MAGPAGFEPAHDGTKNRCLTAWLWPNEYNVSMVIEFNNIHKNIFSHKNMLIYVLSAIDHALTTKINGGGSRTRTYEPDGSGFTVRRVWPTSLSLHVSQKTFSGAGQRT